MTIQKQEFYEGAAIHKLLRHNPTIEMEYSAPFFILNSKLSLYLKYSTATRTPWGFSFPGGEQLAIRKQAQRTPVVLGLICGADGIVALPYGSFQELASGSASAIWISCSRKHSEYYEVSGPDGKLPSKIPPSAWLNLLSTDWTLERLKQ